MKKDDYLENSIINNEVNESKADMDRIENEALSSAEREDKENIFMVEEIEAVSS